MTDAHRDWYEAHAADYDTFTAGDAWTPNRFLAQVLRAGRDRGDDVRSVLDLGSGTGRTLTAVRDVFPAAALTGTDVSAAMLARAGERLPTATLEVADLRAAVTRTAAHYDLVTAIGCAELVPDLPALLPTVFDRVAPGGRLAITVEPPGGDGDATRVDDAGPDDRSPRWRYLWPVAQLRAALPDARVVVEERFDAYVRAGAPVPYVLLVWQR